MRIADIAEEKAARLLVGRGHKILFKNWTISSVAEIDIVCKKSNVVYCVEVRFRRSYQAGGAIDSLNSRKIKQMKRAALMWSFETGWEGALELGCIGFVGEELELDEVLLPL